MRFVDLIATETSLPARKGRWAIVYATADQPLESILRDRASSLGGTVIGCTSSRGVFTPRGFERGAFALVFDEEDPVRGATVLETCSATNAREVARRAAASLEAKLGRRPEALLLHATPGFEERLIQGIDDAFGGNAPPIHGGSAADDDLGGTSRVFDGERVVGEGFVLAGIVSDAPMHGAFVSGYVPGNCRGVVTRVEGRKVLEIDGEPAARVYNRWRDGALDRVMERGGIVIGETTLHPVGRVIDRAGPLPHYLLSHPREVHAGGELSFFTEFKEGDRIVMMLGSRASLLERTDQVVARALGADHPKASVSGGVLIYCGACVNAIGDGAGEVARLYHRALGNAPFVGAATLGEVGSFAGPDPVNLYGNLMCDTLLFG